MSWLTEAALAAVALAPLFFPSIEVHKRPSSPPPDASERTAAPAEPVDDAPIPPALAAQFDAGVTFLRQQTGVKLSNKAKLTFYALYKVAHDGACGSPRPSALDMVACAKWDMWNHYSSMSRLDAMHAYLDLLHNTFGVSAATATLPTDADDDSESESEPDENGGFSISVSRPMVHPDEVRPAVPPSEATPVDALLDGDPTRALAMLADTPSAIDDADEAGWTLLHVAADRGYGAVVRELLARGANVDILDEMGLSPLFYAVVAGNAECVGALLEAGADPRDQRDEAGLTLAEAADSKEIREMVLQKERELGGYEDIGEEQESEGAVKVEENMDENDAEIEETDAETMENDAETAENDAETTENDTETTENDAETAENDCKSAELGVKSAENDIDTTEMDADEQETAFYDAESDTREQQPDQPDKPETTTNHVADDVPHVAEQEVPESASASRKGAQVEMGGASQKGASKKGQRKQRKQQH